MSLYTAYLTVLVRVNVECYVHNHWLPSCNVTRCIQILSAWSSFSINSFLLTTIDEALFKLITTRLKNLNSNLKMHLFLVFELKVQAFPVTDGAVS